MTGRNAHAVGMGLLPQKLMAAEFPGYTGRLEYKDGTVADYLRARGYSTYMVGKWHLVPVTLELGGKSPAIIGNDIDIDDAAKRVAHGKAMNCGQVCLAPDYALVPRARMQEFVRAIRAQFLKMHPSTSGSKHYTCLVDSKAEKRFLEMLQEAKDRHSEIVVCGTIGSDRQYPLHIVSNPDLGLRMMQEEIFGPILPVIPYDTIDDVIAFISERPRPLALYLFSHDAAMRDKVLEYSHSGGVSINDWGWHAFNHDMPFGGIGNSGMGSYHGEEGFRQLSHARSVFKRHRFFPIGLFYPPYDTFVQKLVFRVFLGAPDESVTANAAGKFKEQDSTETPTA